VPEGSPAPLVSSGAVVTPSQLNNVP
jgi:hypothetical protein